MSDRGLSLLLLVIAGVAIFYGSGNPNWLVIGIMSKIVTIIFVIGLVIFVFRMVFTSWPRGLEGLALFVGLFVLGFGLALQEMPKLRSKQAAHWDDYVAKIGALDKFKANKPKGSRVVCKPNEWNILDTTCQYVNDTDKTTTGCFKNGYVTSESACAETKSP